MSESDLPMPAPEDPTRRALLGAATGALAACACAAVLGPAVVALVSPEGGGIVRIGDGAIDLGPLDSFEEGVPRRVVIRGARTDAFLKLGERALGSVLVVRKGSTVTVFSSVCPHAGCDVGPLEGALLCPCHNSRFALDGKVLGGPSPRGLDALDASVETGRVRIARFERFQIGVAEKRSV
jgi:Rieske Fe-S protein